MSKIIAIFSTLTKACTFLLPNNFEDRRYIHTCINSN